MYIYFPNWCSTCQASIKILCATNWLHV